MNVSLVFSLSGLILGITSTALVLILVIYGRSKPHKIWALFNFSVAWWGIGSFFVGAAQDVRHALLISKIAYVGVIFIPVFFYHFSCIFSGINRRFFVIFVYAQAIFFSFLSLTNFIPYISVVDKIGGTSLFYIKSSGLLYNFSIILWVLVVVFGFIETLIQYLKEPIGIKRSQFLYLFLGFFLGFTGGITNFLPVFGFNFIPLGNFTIPIYCVISTYAILRYKLLDIKVVISNTAIFIIVYALVLGIPFFFGYKYHQWQISTWAMLILATTGPFILFYLQRRVEDRLLQEEKRIQGVLIKASEGMTSISNLDKLLKLIINILLNNLRLKGAAVYLLDKESDSYVLKASMPGADSEVSVQGDNFLIHRLNQSKNPVIYEEVDFSKDDNPQNNHAQEIMAQMREMSAEVIIPMALEKVLIGFIVLGERTEKSTYSGTLISVLSIVGTQATLAVQDALYLRAETERVEHEGAQARRSNLDTMVSTMSHQIASPLNSIKLDLAFFEEILNDDDSASPQLKKLLKERVVSTEGIVTHISEIIQSVRDFSRGQIVYENFSIDEMMKSFAPIKNGINKEYPGAVYNENIDPDLPLIFGDQSMLKEILVIYLNNAHQALKHNVGEKIIKLNISRINGNFVRFEVVDNGYGINNEVKKKLFETIYTSKGAGQGMGIGLTRIRRVCELMGAKYGFDSKGEGKGAQFWVDVKIVKNEGTKEG